MKKIILPIIIILLFLAPTLAQNSINIKLIKYNPETRNARIQIHNTANTDLNDIKLNIDNIVEKSIAPFLRDGSAFSIFLTITPGEHELTVTTREGITATKKLYFPLSEEQIQTELEKMASERKLQQKTTPPIPPETKKLYLKYYYVIIALIAVLIIYWLYKKLKTSKK